MRNLIATAMILAVFLVLVVPASDAKVLTGNPIVMVKDKAPPGTVSKDKGRQRFKFIDEAPAVYISGVWLENSETVFSPWGYFDLDETIDLGMTFDWFYGTPAVDGGFDITVSLSGDTVQGKIKRTDFFQALMSELLVDQNGALWFRLGQLPEGRYRIKGKIKGLKPIKGRGKFDLAFDVGDYIIE